MGTIMMRIMVTIVAHQQIQVGDADVHRCKEGTGGDACSKRGGVDEARQS